MTDLLTTYQAGGPGHDEMLQSTGAARAAWAQLADLVDLHSWEQISGRRDEVAQLLEDHGVQYGGEDYGRPWNLDPLPVLLDETEWRTLEAGLAQRSELLDDILADVYGPRRLLSSGVLPPEVILSHPGFLRPADGVLLPGDHQLFLAAADIARNADGSWQVVADRTQAPSGMGYAMEDRRVLAQVLAGLYRKARIHRIGPFFHAMRLALLDVAPAASGNAPRIALLTPGPDGATSFDQAYLSSMLGFPLVQARDLVVESGRLWMRSMDRREPVDVLLRGMDAELCDPLDLRGDSHVGVPGLLHAARQGGVSVVNTFGSGVLENAALLTFLPRICRELRGQELMLSSVVTYWCGERSMCSHVIGNLERLVLKPTARSGDARAVLGWTLSRGERADLAARISAEPHAWVGQEPVEASTAPTVARDGLEARATVLRTFAVARPDGYQVMSGALARVAPNGDATLVPNSSRAIAKDVWVLSSEPYTLLDPWVQEGPPPSSLSASVSPRVAEGMYRLGRCAEQAEGTIRLLRAVGDRWADFHASGATTGGQALEVLRAALTTIVGPAHEAGDGTPDDLRGVLLDAHRPGSVAATVTRLTAAATAVRDQLSGDIWPALSAVERALARARGRPSEGGADAWTLARLLESLHAIEGVAAESMVRDVGWYFMDAGRRLERSQVLVDTLAVTVARRRSAAVDSLVLESLLIANESIITYRRRYQTRANVATVLDLLLLDRHNPRALVFQVDRLEADLAAIPAGGRAGARDRLVHDLQDLLAEIESGPAARSDETGVRRRLVELLDSVGWRLRELDEELVRAHFVHATPQRLDAGTWGAS